MSTTRTTFLVFVDTPHEGPAYFCGDMSSFGSLPVVERWAWSTDPADAASLTRAEATEAELSFNRGRQVKFAALAARTESA